MKRRGAIALLVAVFAAAFLLLALGTALGGPPWTDAPNSWWVASYDVTDYQAATVADGYPDGTFRPGLAVTRAQFAKMVVDGMNVATASPYEPSSFTDVSPTDYFFPWIQGGAQAGIISGFPDGSFGPGSKIVRQQANNILGSYLAQKELNLRGHIAGHLANYPSLNTWYLAEGAAVLSAYADANRLAGVHAPATAYLILKGVVEGAYNNGWMYLGPGENLTRAQAVALILRVQAVTFSTALPTVTNLNPSSGLPAGGNAVVITGTNFVNVTSVNFGSTSVSFTVNSATQISTTAPAGTLGTTVDVTVTTAAGTSATGTASKYTYGLPTVTALTPGSGPAVGGNSVVITGTSLTGATAVKFGTKNATSYVVNSSTQITAVAPSGTAGTTVDVTVTTPGGTTATSAASKYSYGIPVITLISPTSGPGAGGTIVTITGTGFTGVTAVKFGTKAATTYTVNSPTSITATAPSGTVGATIDVSVTTGAGTSVASAATKYTYTGPIITLLSPASGPTIGGNTVVITGSGFSGATSVMFGSVSAVSFIIDSSTQIRAIAPSGTSGTTVYVRVTTPSGTSPDTTAAQYSYGVPVITDLNPSAGPWEGGNTVIITGSGFSSVSSVKFGANTAGFTVNSTTQITAVAPAGVNGTTVQVTVTALGGTSSTTGTANDYTYGADHFKVTMSGGNMPLSSTTKVAGVPFAVRVTAQYADNTTIDEFHGTVSLTSNAWVGSVTAVITDGYVDGVVVTPKIAGTLRYVTATYDTVVTTYASSNFTVNANTVNKLQVLAPGETAAPGTTTGKTGTPNTQAKGAPFSVTVNAVDAYWNIVAVNDTVAITSSDSTATLPPNAALSGGTRSFSVTLNTTGTWTVTATDVTHGAVTANTSSGITATGAFAKLQILLPGETAAPGTSTGKTGTPNVQTAGVSFTVRVNAVDADWNVVSSATDTVRLTSTDGAGVMPADAALIGGSRTFSVQLRTAPGPWTITATDQTNGAITSDTSSNVTVNPGALNHFEFNTVGNQTAGASFSLTVTAYDAFGNLKTNFIGPASLADHTGTLTPTATGGFGSGVWTGNVMITKSAVNDAITASSGGIHSDTNPFDVAAGDPAKVANRGWRVSGVGSYVTTSPAHLSNLTAVDLRMQVLDAWNNPVTARDISAFHPLYHWVGPSTGGLAPDSSFTDTSGYVLWTGLGGVTDAQYQLWLGLDLDGGGDVDQPAEPWAYFTITWGTPAP